MLLCRKLAWNNSSLVWRLEIELYTEVIVYKGKPRYTYIRYYCDNDIFQSSFDKEYRIFERMCEA